MAVHNTQSYDEEIAVLFQIGKWLDKKLKCGGDIRTWMMRSLLKINNKEGREVPFIPNQGQQKIATHWGQKNIILKARQLGISTYVAARFFIDTITRPGTLTVQVAHDQRSAEDIFRIVHRLQEKLPAKLGEGVLKTSRSNVRQLVWPHLDSEYRVETAADSNAGRGMTIRNLHCSEVAMWSRDGAEALVSLRAAVPPSGQVVLESTPNGAGGAFYQEWQAAAETGFVRHFLPWWVEKGYRREGVALHDETDEEIRLMLEQGLDEEQLVYRRELRANYRGKAAQEYAESPEECFLMSGDCAFNADAVEKRLKECEMPEEQSNASEVRDRGRELVWFPAQKGRSYIVGVDTAGGGSDGDYTCAQVIDKADGLQCAELYGHFDPHETANRIAKLGEEFNEALVVVERNNHGHAVLSLLADRYSNLYAANGKLGWLTTVASRPAAVENLGSLLAENPGLFNSARLLRECRTFLRQVDGSSRAAPGTHDDTVMAMAIAQAVRKETAGRGSSRDLRFESADFGSG